MLKPKTRWRMRPYDEQAARDLAQRCGLPALVARLLVQRGITDPDEAERFLNPTPDHFHDPFRLDGMERAVARIRRAIAGGEPILIYGDYDADGVTSTALMVHLLRMLGARFDYYVPNRFTEGYGLHPQAIEWAAEQGFRLLVTVDTGITAVEAVALARARGVDVIITDHHEPPVVLPDAYAIINPKKPGCAYPFDQLAGVGVAFKVAHALLGRPPLEFLDLAAVGTIADLVPLVDENRVLAKLGLAALNGTNRPGFRALLRVSGLEGKPVDEGHVGFALGPRLNAGGRLDSADDAVRLLTTDDPAEADALAKRLDALNRQRQDLVERIVAEAAEEVAATCDWPRDRAIVVAREGWNIGVVGIVASKLVERFYRPTVVLSIDSASGVAKGSARSIEGFDLFQALSTCRDLFTHFGGHPMAAGLTLPADAVPLLRQRFNAVARARLQDEDLVPVTHVDAACALSEVTLEAVETVMRLSPFGVGNPFPRVHLSGVRLAQFRRVGRDGQHFKALLADGSGTLDAVGFSLGELADSLTPADRLDVVGELAVNEWNGMRRPQLILRDVAVPHLQVFDWRGVPNPGERLREVPAPSRTVVFAFADRHERELAYVLDVVGSGLRGGRVMPDGTVRWFGAPPAADEVEHVVLYDLPTNREALRRVLKAFPRLSRVYCLFGADPDSAFGAFPGREAFKAVYCCLPSGQTRRLDETFFRAVARFGVKPRTARFILEVFAELGLVMKAADGVVRTPNPPRRRLSDSRRYREEEERCALERELVYSSQTALAEWFAQLLGETVNEEALCHGHQL
ncbi:MAG TPA: single-stranded-DNA-specific exonuclease RecJ [Calditerricola sp.]